jgi:hypothetical protein
MITIDDYKLACDCYPGSLDENAVDGSLKRYLSALGVDRDVRRLRRGWTLDDEPAIERLALELAKEIGAALAARDARDAISRLSQWVIGAASWWCSWELGWVAATAFGARQHKAKSVSAWAEPLLDAYVAGCWRLIWTQDTLYWVAKPRVYVDAGRRLHREDGPALLADDMDAWFWRGTLIPDDWLPNRASLDPSIALTWPRIEERRCAADIIGWHRVLSQLDAKTIDRHPDPQVGELIEVDIPDAGRERFLRVLCGTNREFALPVPPNMRTAIEAQAWTYGFDDPKKFKLPEIRT